MLKRSISPLRKFYAFVDQTPTVIVYSQPKLANFVCYRISFSNEFINEELVENLPTCSR